MQIVVGANRLPKYWINILLFCTALHYSTWVHQIWVTGCGVWRWNAMWKICILCKKLWKMWKVLCRTIISLPWCIKPMVMSSCPAQPTSSESYRLMDGRSLLLMNLTNMTLFLYLLTLASCFLLLKVVPLSLRLATAIAKYSAKYKPGAARIECTSATMLLCWQFGIDMDDMDNSLFRVGTECTITAWGKYYIANITPCEGAIIYAYVVCCLDIGYAATFLSCFSQAPAREHYKAPMFPTHDLLQLTGYVDAAHATDLKTHCSISGYVFTWPVVPSHSSWNCKLPLLPVQPSQNLWLLWLLLSLPSIFDLSFMS